MPDPITGRPMLRADVCTRALGARDARFDGLFYVGIITTRVYCRPMCPARVSYPDHRRFFDSAAAAECAGFRPCLRCRPELAPGRAPFNAVPRLADAAAYRIGAGALNGHSVADLARELGVSARHLRRALERQVGVSPVALAQTHRLLLAKRLLADTGLSVTRIAFASGFQSLRRFNTVFRERYRMSPSAVRRGRSSETRARRPGPAGELLRLTLAYRPPFAWDLLLRVLRRDATPGVELVEGRRYARTVGLSGRSGVIF
ncbi:MAG: DNA-3-methyladenine glycosylase 2 family protein, partial [Gemmatimonadales bacterium]|nr:DNA-3-methyladenine glycosylase 2 family protein [Gemmatimonadales bacterium]